MKLRTRTILIVILLTVGAITVYNLKGNLLVLSKLPDHRLHHIEAARREAQKIPFEKREHRLERRPRLEHTEPHGMQSTTGLFEEILSLCML